ncbi:uncharacterized protein [Rutidosis leptorrhynchoides]|uniref:uncharacterized protein isoform X3 n=1 Tax=Rutidosis leptorrhynchoides TaxID=125765 RepID=UPI003A9907DB
MDNKIWFEFLIFGASESIKLDIWLYFRYLDLFVVTFILSKVARTSIAQVLTVISQTQKFALREASRTRSVCLLICALRKPKLFEDVLQSIKYH